MSFEPKDIKIVGFGDFVVPSGFGRIGNEVFTRLQQRGYQVMAASIQYGGGPHPLPFWVWPLAGHMDLWGSITNIINQSQPDVVIGIQDFPYHVSLFRDCKIDWSKTKFIFITPIDGEPIDEEWIQLSKVVDAGMVISHFGQEAMRRNGVKLGLCYPGINPREFYPAKSDEKLELRRRAGFPEDAYIVGMFAMNQGRKNIPATVEAFRAFSVDKPNTYLYLDMDDVSPAGWNIERQLLKPMGVDPARVKYRKDVQHLLPNLRDRYCLLNAHTLISFREGFGLPTLEAMACGIPSYVLDWCSGPELAEHGRGVLVTRQEMMTYGTWGGAKDAYPVMQDFIEKLNWLYSNREEAALIARKGYEWAKQQSWDKTADAVEEKIMEVLGVSFDSGASLWQPSRPTQISTGVDADVASTGQPGASSADGSDLDGRLQSGVRSDDDLWASLQSLEESTKSRLLRQLQPGSEGSNGTVPSVHELGSPGNNGHEHERGLEPAVDSKDAADLPGLPDSRSSGSEASVSEWDDPVLWGIV